MHAFACLLLWNRNLSALDFVIFSRGVKRKSSEDNAKKASRKKVDQNANNSGNAVHHDEEEAGRQMGRKKSSKHSMAERKLDKAKAWRRSTIRRKAIDLSDDDNDDDFELLGNGKGKIAFNGCIKQMDDVSQVGSPSGNLKCHLDDGADRLELKCPNELENDMFSNEHGEMRAGSAHTKNDKMPQLSTDNISLRNNSEDNDDYFLCTQNISNFLPSSTPTRDFRALSAKSSVPKTKRRTLEASVPPPPSCDLDSILDDDIQVDDLLSGRGKIENDTHIRGKYKAPLSFTKTSVSDDRSNEAKEVDSETGEKDLDCNLQYLDPLNKSDKLHNCNSEGLEISPSKHTIHANNGEISNLDLFGDSLMIDFEDDFDDCPSPPVVSQCKVNDVKDHEKGPKTMKSCLGTKSDVVGTKYENNGKNIGTEFHDVIITRDDTRTSMFGLQRNEATDTRSIQRDLKHDSNEVDYLHDVDELAFQLADNEVFGDESNFESLLPMPSLKSRLQNRRGDVTGKTALKTYVDSEMEGTVEVQRSSVKISNEHESPCPEEPVKENSICSRSVNSANKTVNSNEEVSVTHGLVADSHMEGDSPKLNNIRRRKKVIGRITDDSPTPTKESVVSIADSSDDEFDSGILRRRKAKKIIAFKSPPVKRQNQSSDEDFECGKFCIVP